MKKINVNVYKFDELSKDVQEKLIEKNRDIYTDFDWYSVIFDNFSENVKQDYGIEINIENIKFSGFYSQGDGASFTVADIPVETLLKLFRITIPHGLENLFCESVNFSIERTNHRYCHENTVSAAYENNFNYNYPQIYNLFDKLAEKIIGELEKLKNKLCGTLYRDLESEYEFLTSDNVIKEWILDQDDYYFLDGANADNFMSA